MADIKGVTNIAVVIGLAWLATGAYSQIILTQTNAEGSYTTGNRLDLPDRLDLFSPITFDIPLLLDSDLYSNMSKYQSYKNSWIIDIANVDPKEFAPEDPNYNIAVQRRGIPFIYLGKIFFVLLLLLMIARLFYGYLGGYRQKAKNLKGPEKRAGNKILWTGTVIFFFFYLQYLGSVFYSSEITTKYLSQSIYDYALKTEESVNQTFAGINLINNSSMPAYYADLEFEKFHIANLLDVVMKETNSIIVRSKATKEQVEMYERRNLMKSLLLFIGMIVQFAVLRYAYSKRKIYYSLVCALGLVFVAGYCCTLNGRLHLSSGFRFNITTIKIEMCQQSTEVIKINKIPLYGNGVASIVTSFSNEAKTRMQEQIYEFNIGINSAFRMYVNRLKAMQLHDEYNHIYNSARNKTGGVWDVFFDFNSKKRTDKILKDSFITIKRIWRMYYEIESLLEGRFLKFWSYTYSNNICKYGIYVDLGGFSALWMAVLGIIIMATGSWMNEYIVRCIIYEESRYLNVEKYRHDWI